MTRTTKRRRLSAIVASLATAVAGLAGLIVTTAAPASAGINPNTKYELDCYSMVGSVSLQPFIVTANLNASPNGYFTGAAFGAAGALSFTVQGGTMAAYNHNNILVGGQIGLNVGGVQIASTDGTATGNYSYSHNFPAQTPAQHNVTSVSFTNGSTTLSGNFALSDIGSGVDFTGFFNGQTIIAVNPGVSATLNIASTATGTGTVTVFGATTYTDAAVSTGNVFSTNGVNGGQARIGIVGQTGGYAFPGALTVPFGTGGGGQNPAAQPAGHNTCMLVGYDGASVGSIGNVAAGPTFPAGVTTALVASSNGFVQQTGTTAAEAITPPAAAFVTLSDPPPVASSSSVNLGVGQSTTTSLSVASGGGTSTQSCALVPASISDPRLSVTIDNSPSLCTAHLSDSGSTPQVVTFQFTASNASSTSSPATVTVNIGTPPVHEQINQQVNGGQLVLSCSSPETYLPGSALLTCPTIDLPAITLNGLQQTAVSNGSTLYVSDNRGLPTNTWTLTASMIPTASNPNATCGGVAAFCNSSIGSSASSANGKIAASLLALSNIGCAVHAGNLNPAPTAGANGTFASTRTLCTANVGQSGGTFDVTKTYTLSVPSSVFAGTYMGTVEYLVQ